MKKFTVFILSAVLVALTTVAVAHPTDNPVPITGSGHSSSTFEGGTIYSYDGAASAYVKLGTSVFAFAGPEHIVQAQFDAIAGGKDKLRKDSDSTIEVPLDPFSEVTVEWISKGKTVKAHFVRGKNEKVRDFKERVKSEVADLEEVFPSDP